MGDGGVTVNSLSELIKNVSSIPYMEFLEGMLQKILDVLSPSYRAGIVRGFNSTRV